LRSVEQQPQPAPSREFRFFDDRKFGMDGDAEPLSSAHMDPRSRARALACSRIGGRFPAGFETASETVFRKAGSSARKGDDRKLRKVPFCLQAGPGGQARGDGNWPRNPIGLVRTATTRLRTPGCPGSAPKRPKGRVSDFPAPIRRALRFGRVIVGPAISSGQNWD